METWNKLSEFLGELPLKLARPIAQLIEQTAKPLTVPDEVPEEKVVAEN